ncbi:LlsX family protein [Caldibacillus debilis]|jgi:hypothetical protein|uniref:Uncharacterized protein n=1 Tax=Caldibacillus debilis TaxID=301148 RepID=A0A150MDV9_9BACI|nr:DUF5963 family protein [Caldibacillus debilis]KYD22661.1 hypothetical protein B4135_1144 [Caldibacillus debilis]
MNLKRLSVSFLLSLVITFLFFALLITYHYSKIDLSSLKETQSFSLFGLEYYRIEVGEEDPKGIPNSFNMSLFGVVLGILLFFVLELQSKKRSSKR